MSIKTVTHQLVAADASPLPNVYTEIVLLAPGAVDGAYDAQQRQVLSRVVLRTDSEGSWATQLIANAEITPAGTVYQVTHKVIGFPDQVAAFIVPTGGGTVILEDLLVDLPEDIPPQASLVAFDPQDSGMSSVNVENAILEAYAHGGGGGGGGSEATYTLVDLTASPISDAWLVQGGGALNVTGFLKVAVQDTTNANYKVITAQVELFFVAGTAGVAGNEIRVDSEVLMQNVTALNAGWVAPNGPKGLWQGTIAGVWATGAMFSADAPQNARAVLCGYGGQPILDGLVIDDTLFFNVSWLMEVD